MSTIHHHLRLILTVQQLVIFLQYTNNKWRRVHCTRYLGDKNFKATNQNFRICRFFFLTIH